jgi:predicted nucleotidyltransferase component of viral defense system
LAEILAEKIRACYQRNKARDIFDLGTFATRPLDHALIRRLVVLRIEITPGQVEWEEPTERVHRAVNIGKDDYEQVTVFLLDRPDAVPQPGEE